MKLAPSQRLLGLGAVLLTALLICSRNFSRTGELPFLLPLAVASLAYLLALRELFHAPPFPRRVIFFGLALAAVWHVVFLRMSPGPDDDIHRYVWDGRVQRLGYNPYSVVPNDPGLASLHTVETRTLNNPEVPSPYPPGAQLFFRGVTAIHESASALKVAFVVCDVAIVFVLLDLFRRTQRAKHWVLAYAWHPLLATEVVGSGHVDIVGALFLLVSALALVRRWRSVAAVAFALSVAVKLLPIVLLPLYWKRVRMRDAMLAVAVLALLCVPFLDHGRVLLGSLGTYVQRFRFNDPVFAHLERVLAPRVVAGLALVAGLVTAMWMRRKSEADLCEAFSWPMAASLFCAPVVYPWYLVWLLPFMGSVATLPLIIWTLSIIPTYYVWRLRTLGLPWVVPDWILWFEYGSVAMVGTIVVYLRVSQPTESHAAADRAEES